MLVRLGMRCFGGLVTRKSQEQTKDSCDYCVHLKARPKDSQFSLLRIAFLMRMKVEKKVVEEEVLVLTKCQR